MTRAELQQLAEDRLLDAQALLAAQRWSAAYYLAGYAVECGLKSCILGRVIRQVEVIFADRRFSDKCWTHKLLDLVALADLDAVQKAAIAANSNFKDNWDTVGEWTESSRYGQFTKDEAEVLYSAIADSNHGVMQWIKGHW